MSQYQVLSILYNKMGGPSWKSNNWFDYSDVCTFDGIMCDDNHKFVKSLILDGFGLIGVIPSEIMLLPSLVNIKLSNNQLHGEIPQEIYIYGVAFGENHSNTSQVDYNIKNSIDFKKNSLSFGQKDIDMLNRLTSLDLSYNLFSGTFPSGLFNIQNVNMSNNNFFGSLDKCISEFFQSATSSIDGNVLFDFDIYGNSLSGIFPSSLSKFPSLRRLAIGRNSFSGTLPTELTKLSQLEVLLFMDNLVSGTVPSEIGLFNNLKEIDWSNNKIYGNLPSEIGNVATLQTLRMGNNAITNTLPTSLRYLKSLSLFDGSNNSLSGSIPTEIGTLKMLNALSVSSNSITGSIPTELSNLTSLQWLNLESNMLTGSLPLTILQSLSSLRFLNIASNDFSGSISYEMSEIIFGKYNATFVLSQRNVID